MTDLFLQELISFGKINIPTLTLNAVSLLCLFSLSSSTVKIYVLGKEDLIDLRRNSFSS